MVRTVKDLEDQVLYEMAVLSVMPETDLAGASVELDLRSGGVVVRAHAGVAEVGAAGVTELRRRLQPLFVGVAWKILDQLVAHQIAIPGSSVGHQAITTRVNRAKNCDVPSPFPARHKNAWCGILDAYGALQEYRHGLTHRGVRLPTGSVLRVEAPGQAPDLGLTQEQQIAFCRLSRVCLEMILAATFADSLIADIGGQLAKMVPLIVKRGWIQRDTSRIGEIVIAPRRDARGVMEIDLGDVERQRTGNLADCSAIDLVVETYEVPGVFLVGPLELAHARRFKLSTERYPKWMHQEFRAS